MTTLPIPLLGLNVLNTLAREVSEAEREANTAVGNLDRARARNVAVQAALASALGVKPGSVIDLDLQKGCFVVSDETQTADKTEVS